MKRYFVTSSGTGIGKTLFTAALAHQLQQSGRRVRALKPVISGYDKEDTGSDTALLLSAQGLPSGAVETISPWRFAAPLSPDMAAEDEGRSIDFDRLVSFCKAETQADYLLVEGVGGVMVPLDERHTVLGWAAALDFPVILVAGSYLGSLSHTLSAAKVLKDAGLALHTLVISESESSPVPVARIKAALSRFLPKGTQVITIGRLDSSPELWKYVPEMHSLF